MCRRPKAPKISVPDQEKKPLNILSNPFLDALSGATAAIFRGRLGVSNLTVRQGQSTDTLAGLNRNPLTTYGGPVRRGGGLGGGLGDGGTGGTVGGPGGNPGGDTPRNPLDPTDRGFRKPV